jgi:hypothetical protein
MKKRIIALALVLVLLCVGVADARPRKAAQRSVTAAEGATAVLLFNDAEGFTGLASASPGVSAHAGPGGVHVVLPMRAFQSVDVSAGVVVAFNPPELVVQPVPLVPEDIAPIRYGPVVLTVR